MRSRRRRVGKITRLHLTEYPDFKPRNEGVTTLLRDFWRSPNYQRLAKVRNLKRCPRRLRAAVRQAKKNTIIVVSTPRGVDDWFDELMQKTMLCLTPVQRAFVDVIEEVRARGEPMRVTRDRRRDV